ncbi:DUF421 domain-containing protein [Thermorudis peleae]|uniref:DUF421 domain-containing protein n=1 Tax=Thermorudis peleae TaxID=1382356 RepID=UPI000571A00B|nr:YetF domain-containing protein [Thermorudis peleae]
MWHLQIPAWEIAVRSLLIYFALLLGLRLFGKRQVGQFTLFDLALVLLVANAVQPAMTGPDSSLTGGLIIIAVLLLANWVVSRLLFLAPPLRHVLEPTPTILAQNGKWIPSALAREGIDQEEAEMAIREHELSDVSETQLVVLEPDGSISVVPKDATVYTSQRRRRRYRRHP